MAALWVFLRVISSLFNSTIFPFILEGGLVTQKVLQYLTSVDKSQDSLPETCNRHTGFAFVGHIKFCRRLDLAPECDKYAVKKKKVPAHL